MTKKHTLFRGVHLRDRKEGTSERATEILPNPSEVTIPLSQHIGTPALPVVAVGDRVKRGSLIGKKQGLISANVHASVGGTVSGIMPLKDGHGTAITIQTDESSDTAYMPPLERPSPQEIAERVEWAGIVGMGGAGFPTHVKIQPKQPVDSLVLNGAECEPYLTCDHRLMVEKTERIVRGAEYLARAIGASKIVVGIEQNKPQAIELFKHTQIPVTVLPKRYPMGSERHLVFAVTGRKIPLLSLPASVGVVVQNVATAFAVCEAVEMGKPLIERVVTLSGNGIGEPKNILTPIGAPLSSLVQFSGGLTGTLQRMIAGGPMTGKALNSLDYAIEKRTSGVLFLSKEQTSEGQITPCINCGRCAERCPMRLMPMQIEFYTAAGEYGNAERYGGVLSCIECGTCSYVCPARRPLTQAIRSAKDALNGRN